MQENTPEVKTTKRKAKRKLTDIDFDSDKSHIALVSDTVNGGPANGADYALVMKGTSNFSEEFLQKASQIKVTMPVEEFLRKFFGMYWDDAELLARMMGFTTVEQEWEEEYKKNNPDYKPWIEEKLQNFEILKSAKSAENLAKFLSELNEEQYLALLQDQEMIEKAMLNDESVAQAADTSTDINPVENKEVEVAKATSNINPVEKSMPEVKTVEKSVEMVEKSVLVDIQKAFEQQKEELQKAVETINAFKQAEKERIVKARTNQVEESVGNKELAEVICKAALLVEDETEFQNVVKALAELAAKSKEASDDLFAEKGASDDVKEKEAENKVASILKAKFQSK